MAEVESNVGSKLDYKVLLQYIGILDTCSLCKLCKTGLPDIMELQMSHTNLNLLFIILLVSVGI